MSSFPDHITNMKDLHDMGFDVSDAVEYGEITLDSWSYDEQVYQMSEVIKELKAQNFKVAETK